MTFGEKLKKLRTEHKLTQDELAEKIYVTRTAISKWESDRGYPNIDSLKALSKFFSVTVDELLSSDEVLTIAESDNRQRELRYRNLVYSLLDLCTVILLFLPFFADNTSEIVESVSLLALCGVQPYIKASFFATVIGTFVTGALTLVLQSRQPSAWTRIKTPVSLALSTASVLLFTISSQPYAAVFAFVLLTIKVLMLIKR